MHVFSQVLLQEGGGRLLFFGKFSCPPEVFLIFPYFANMLHEKLTEERKMFSNEKTKYKGYFVFKVKRAC